MLSQTIQELQAATHGPAKSANDGRKKQYRLFSHGLEIVANIQMS